MAATAAPANQPETEADDLDAFEQDLKRLINKYSLENGSNTPDFVIAAYLRRSLQVFNAAMKDRDNWWGFNPWSINEND